MDATRTIKTVSIIQQPVIPEFAIQPNRIYGIAVTLFISFLILGILNLLKFIILDHVD